MPKTRTTHVRRIKNADDEEIWIDVERVDKIVNKQEGQGGLFRKTTRMMFWGDEADDAAHPTRGMTELRVEKPETPDTFVNINVIDKQKTRRGQGPDYKKKHKWFFNDKETNTTREVSFRRVYHWDTATDPNDDGGTEYVRLDGTEDREQYLDVAVIEKLIQRRGQGPSYKKRTYQFNTDPIKEFSEPSPGDVDPATVVWLDPWQNIINVKWEEEPYLVLQFYYRAGPRAGDIQAAFHGFSADLPLLEEGPANSTYAVSIIIRTEAFIGVQDAQAEDSPFQLSGFPPAEEFMAAPRFLPGSYEAYFPPGELSGGTNEFKSRHTHTPGGPLTNQKDAEQTVPIPGNPHYTDTFSIVYTMYTDEFTGASPFRQSIPSAPDEIVYPSTSGQNSIYHETSWNFSGATIFDTESEKTYRAIGTAFREREPTEADRRNGPLYILFKHDPDA